MDKARSIVNGIVGIARDMRIETVAEGIEDMGQVDFLESVGAMWCRGTCSENQCLPMSSRISN